MAPRIDEVRFYADEMILGLGQSLAAARRDVIYCGHPLIPECPRGILDDQWIPLVANRGLIALTRDRHIRTRPAEKLAVKESGLRRFVITVKKDIGTWGWLVLMVRHWDAIEKVIAERPTGPWLYAVNQSGVAPISLDH